MEQQTSFIIQDFFYFSTNIYVETDTFQGHELLVIVIIYTYVYCSDYFTFVCKMLKLLY